MSVFDLQKNGFAKLFHLMCKYYYPRRPVLTALLETMNTTVPFSFRGDAPVILLSSTVVDRLSQREEEGQIGRERHTNRQKLNDTAVGNITEIFIVVSSAKQWLRSQAPWMMRRCCSGKIQSLFRVSCRLPCPKNATIIQDIVQTRGNVVPVRPSSSIQAVRIFSAILCLCKPRMDMNFCSLLLEALLYLRSSYGRRCPSQSRESAHARMNRNKP